MLGENQDTNRQRMGGGTVSNIVQIGALVAFLAFMFTHGPWVDHVMAVHPTLSALAGWGGGMLSYHQDAKRHGLGWALLSEIFAVACLVALVVLGFRHGAWANFLIAPALAWLQFQFTKRWWARPGAWW